MKSAPPYATLNRDINFTKDVGSVEKFAPLRPICPKVPSILNVSSVFYTPHLLSGVG